MYKRPNPKKQAARLAFIYTVMTTAVLAIVTVLVLLVLNYRFGEDGSLERRGLVQFASAPSGADITINDRRISARTSTKHSVAPGEHTFMMEREGYEPWSKTLHIEAGSLVWLDYVRLVPTEKQLRTVETYEELHASMHAPGRERIILQPHPDVPEFHLVNILGSDASSQSIALPPELYEDMLADDGLVHEFTMVRWDSSGRYVLVQHDYGSDTEWIVLDTRNPENSQNVSREFAISLRNVRFSGTSGNVLYAVHNDNLRKLNLSEGTISRPLVSDVEEFELYDTNAAAYVTHQDDDGLRHLGVYREGDTEQHIVQSTEHTDAAIAVTEFYGDSYVAIAEGEVVNIYQGLFTNGPLESGAEPLQTIDMQASVDTLEFSAAGRNLLVRAGSYYGHYNIENATHSSSRMQAGSSMGLGWLDDMYAYNDAGGTLQIGEIDGTNIHSMNDVVEGHAVTLSRNGTFLYSIGQNEDGEFVLQRMRMIL